MRHFLLTGALGLLLLIVLFYYSGVDRSLNFSRRSAGGWASSSCCGSPRSRAPHGRGRACFRPRRALRRRSSYGLRLVREGINTLLPVAQVGGEFVGARLAARNGLSIGEAGASVAVDLLSQAVTQAVFTIAGHSGARVARRRADDGPRRRADAARARAGIDRLFRHPAIRRELAGSSARSPNCRSASNGCRWAR